jgi:hypothetical protein
VTGTTAPPTTDMRAHAPGDTAKPRGAAASSKTTAPGASATVAPTTIALAQRGIATEKPASDSGGVPIGLILGGVLVAVLFTVGALAARRRRSTA